MSARILVVDDDEPLQRVVKRAAEAVGYEVVQTSDGHDALSLAAHEKVDVILLDINMPAMDGRDVLSRLKQNAETSSIPVLVCSSRSGQLDRQVVLELGAEEFVEKPMDARVLMRKIGRLIGAVRARTGGGA